MQGVVIHAPGDLRVETVAVAPLGPRDVRVRIETGGICGSDMHYYRHGGFGAVRLREPMVLGHETAGTVEALGGEVANLAPGMRVALNPSRPCGRCRYCRDGQRTHCLDMHYFGSAMRFPHAQGMFRQQIVVDQAQVFPIADGLSMAEAATAEPLAVALHAAARAGTLIGKRVLVTGCGPIGALVIAAARFAGAAEVVATDVGELPLATALRLGASRAIHVGRTPEAMADYAAGKGAFDVLFEASGNERALRGALDTVRPGGRVVQLGLGGDMTLPVNTLVAKELDFVGSFRFDGEFGLAVELMGRRLIDVTPVLSATLPFQRASEAFELAGDRDRAMKVQLSFA